jgi:type II secretory pathway pseudopilin PulG
MESLKIKAVTLVEVMIVVLVILIAVGAVFGVFTASLALVVEARERTLATDDLEDVLEYIRTLPFAHITEPGNGGFSDGGSVAGSLVGGFLLENEQVTVRYPQGTDIDPLEIEVEVNWEGRYGRVFSQTFRTLRSSRL